MWPWLWRLITERGSENGVNEAGDEGDLIIELGFTDLFETLFAPPSGPLSLLNGAVPSNEG